MDNLATFQNYSNEKSGEKKPHWALGKVRVPSTETES